MSQNVVVPKHENGWYVVRYTTPAGRISDELRYFHDEVSYMFNPELTHPDLRSTDDLCRGPVSQYYTSQSLCWEVRKLVFKFEELPK